MDSLDSCGVRQDNGTLKRDIKIIKSNNKNRIGEW